MSALAEKNAIWFVYDGECPLCKSAALALRIKKQYGTHNLLNAREHLDHQLIIDINRHGFDLDEGMVIFDGNDFYHGKDALSFMAKFGDSKGLFNLLNKAVFGSETMAKMIYPWIRGVRNLLLKKKNIGRIDNLNLKSEPIFKAVFGDSWDKLPPVMHKHYMNRPYTDDINIVEGTLDVMSAGPIKLLAPIFWLMGGVPPHNENNVPVTVSFESNKNTKEFRFNRTFNFKECKPYHFQSRMVQTSANEMIEIMRFGFGWRMSFHWEDDSVKLKHKGYVLSLFGHFIPLPLTMLMGKGNAEEKAVDNNTFDMQVEITHPWWGKIYEYKGRFVVKDKR